MDLSTVVAHEQGHVLGLEHDSTGVMEARLAPGVLLLPAALPGTGMVTVATSVSPGPSASGARAGELGVRLPSGPLSASSPTETTDGVFASAVRGGVLLSPSVAQDRAGTQRSVSAVLADRAQQAPLTTATRAASRPAPVRRRRR
jgi:hypothetical protein